MTALCLSPCERSMSLRSSGKSTKTNSSSLAREKVGTTQSTCVNTNGYLVRPSLLWCERPCAGANPGSVANSMTGRRVPRQCTLAGSMIETSIVTRRLKKVFGLARMRGLIKLIAPEDHQTPIAHEELFDPKMPIGTRSRLPHDNQGPYKPTSRQDGSIQNASRLTCPPNAALTIDAWDQS